MAHRCNKSTASCGKTYDIQLSGLIAGVCDMFNLGAHVTQMLPKVGPHVKVECGTLFTIAMAMLGTQSMSGLSSIDSFVIRSPMPFILANPASWSPELCSLKYLNRYVFADLLDRIVAYGASQFVLDITRLMVDPAEVTIARGDSTSYHLDGAVRAELPEGGKLNRKQRRLLESMKKARFSTDRNAIVLTRGYSRDNHPHNAQVNQFALCTRTSVSDKPMVIFQSAFSGNTNDISYFARCMEADLSKILKEYPFLRYVIFDSAGCTERMIRALTSCGVHLITRVPDKNKQVKLVLKRCEEQQIELTKLKVRYCGEEREIEVATLGMKPLTAKEDSPEISMMLVKAEAMRDQKVELIKGRAQAEKLALEASIKVMAPSDHPAFACEADARKAFDALAATAKLCHVSAPTIEEVRKHKKAGRPAAGDKGEIIGYNVRAAVEIDEAAVAKAIEHELYYVLGSTDPNISPKDMFEFYHEQSDIEGCWRDIKLPGSFLDAFHIKSPSRIRALLALVTLALNVQRIALSQVWRYLTEHGVSLVLASGKWTKRPSMKKLLNCHGLSGAKVFFDQNGFRFEEILPGTVLHAFLQEQRPEIRRYYDPSSYEDYYEHFKVFYDSIKEHDQQTCSRDDTPAMAANEWQPNAGSLAVG